jgi:hypothetical protein
MDEAAISNVAGDGNYVRVQVLTPVGVLDDKQLGVVGELRRSLLRPPVAVVVLTAGGRRWSRRRRS